MPCHQHREEGSGLPSSSKKERKANKEKKKGNKKRKQDHPFMLSMSCLCDGFVVRSIHVNHVPYVCVMGYPGS